MSEPITIPPLPVSIVRRFQELQFNPEAKCHYEYLSGGLKWSDEISPELMKALFEQDNPVVQVLYRYLWAYRASLIKGNQREEFRVIWESVLQQVPEWPGFRSERSSPEQGERLMAGAKGMLRDLERTEKVLARAERIEEIRSQRK